MLAQKIEYLKKIQKEQEEKLETLCEFSLEEHQNYISKIQEIQKSKTEDIFLIQNFSKTVTLKIKDQFLKKEKIQEEIDDLILQKNYPETSQKLQKELIEIIHCKSEEIFKFQDEIFMRNFRDFEKILEKFGEKYQSQNNVLMVSVEMACKKILEKNYELVFQNEKQEQNFGKFIKISQNLLQRNFSNFFKEISKKYFTQEITEIQNHFQKRLNSLQKIDSFRIDENLEENFTYFFSETHKEVLDIMEQIFISFQNFFEIDAKIFNDFSEQLDSFQKFLVNELKIFFKIENQQQQIFIQFDHPSKIIKNQQIYPLKIFVKEISMIASNSYEILEIYKDITKEKNFFYQSMYNNYQQQSALLSENGQFLLKLSFSSFIRESEQMSNLFFSIKEDNCCQQMVRQILRDSFYYKEKLIQKSQDYMIENQDIDYSSFFHWIGKLLKFIEEVFQDFQRSKNQEGVKNFFDFVDKILMKDLPNLFEKFAEILFLEGIFGEGIGFLHNDFLLSNFGEISQRIEIFMQNQNGIQVQNFLFPIIINLMVNLRNQLKKFQHFFKSIKEIDYEHVYEKLIDKISQFFGEKLFQNEIQQNVEFFKFLNLRKIEKEERIFEEFQKKLRKFFNIFKIYLPKNEFLNFQDIIMQKILNLIEKILIRKKYNQKGSEIIKNEIFTFDEFIIDKSQENFDKLILLTNIINQDSKQVLEDLIERSRLEDEEKDLLRNSRIDL